MEVDFRCGICIFGRVPVCTDAKLGGEKNETKFRQA